MISILPIQDVALATTEPIINKLFAIFQKHIFFHKECSGKTEREYYKACKPTLDAIIAEEKLIKKEILPIIKDCYGAQKNFFFCTKGGPVQYDELFWGSITWFYNFLYLLEYALTKTIPPPPFKGSKRQKSPPGRAYDYHNVHNRGFEGTPRNSYSYLDCT